MPGGLSDLIARQLERQMAPRSRPAPARSASTAAVAGPGGSFAERNGRQRQVDFVRTHGEAARAAEAETGLPAAFVLAQAARTRPAGASARFATRRQQREQPVRDQGRTGMEGRRREAVTTEVVDGQAHQGDAALPCLRDPGRVVSRLRTPDEGQCALQPGAGQRAQRRAVRPEPAVGGYATDPEYAGKLGRVINATLQLQRVLG